ncbi:hypothetical protein BFT35_11315 [Thermoanaerobacterium thermosaccharolyticum]|nr:hypothetical protein BFT35_11315 [Thermoanaerobacterium thermosaccharolyticum]
MGVNQYMYIFIQPGAMVNNHRATVKSVMRAFLAKSGWQHGNPVPKLGRDIFIRRCKLCLILKG